MDLIGKFINKLIYLLFMVLDGYIRNNFINCNYYNKRNYKNLVYL